MIFESNTISLAKVSDGQDGVGQYVHIMYSDVENPQSPGDISTVPLDYMGICINNSPIAPTDPGQYTWSKIKGEDGRPGTTGRPGQPGQDGATYYIHIKWSNDGGQSFSEGSGAWLGVYTDTSPDPIEIPMLYQWTRVAGTDGTVITLSNESHTVPTDSNGLAGNYTGADTTITVYEGKTDTTSLWNISYIESKGISGTFSNNKYTLTEIIEDTGYVDFTATREGYSKLTKRFQIARTKSGESAMTYKLLCEPTVIHKDNLGNLSTNEIILSAKSYTDTSNDNYLGHFKVTADNSVIYESAKNESAAVVRIPSASVQIKVELYASTMELLDSQSVAIVTDGQHGTNGKTYSLNIKGDTTTIIYDYNGSNPMPLSVQPFSAELYENGKLITSDIEYSWGSKSVKSIFSGVSSNPTFIPMLSPTYNMETQYENAIVLIAKYAEQVLYAVQPIIVQQSAKPGENTISAVLSNESHVIPTDSEGNSGNYTGAETTISIYEGTKDVSIAWTVKAEASEGIAGSLTEKTYTVTEISVDSGYVEFTCSRNGYPDIIKRFQLSRVKSGSSGSTGEAAASYWLLCSSNIIYKSPDGKITPEIITITGKTQKGSEPVASYGCRYKILVNDKVIYTSTTDEITKEYKVPLDAKSISIEMYSSGDTSVLLDQQGVQVLTDGLPGKGVVSVDVMYYKSSSALSLSDGEWVSKNPGWEEGKYIWSKTIVTYSDDSVEETIPVCITGSAGETGKGIKSIIEEYYKSTSSVELKDGTWESTYPGWESDKFIWTRSTIEYTDGTSKITDPICVSGSKGVDGTPGYTVYLTNQYETFLCNSSNEIVKESPVSTKAMVYKGSEELSCTIGEIATIPGMSILVTENMITFTALKGTELAERGSVEIPIMADKKYFTASFSWSKIVDASGDLEEIKTSITEVKNITDNLNERIELSVTKTEFNDSNAAINKQFSQLNISLEGITSEVSSMKTDFGDQIAANSTKIEQTDKKLSLIATGDGESGITITPGFIQLISTDIIGIAAKEFNIDGLTTFMNSATSGDKTVINGGAIDTVSLTAKIIEAQILKSKNYKEGTDSNSPYSIEGTFYNLETGALISENFAINEGGDVFVRGTVHATNGSFSGTITGSTINGTTINGGTINGTHIQGGSSITCGAKFKVTSDGKLTATDAIITGNITATSGSFAGTITATNGEIGGFHITDDSLYSGTDSLGGSGVYVSPNGISCGSNFQVNSSGYLIADSGEFGPWYISTDSIYRTNSSWGASEGMYFGTQGLSVSSSFTVDSSGKLNATNANISGNIIAKSIDIYDEIRLYNSSIGTYTTVINFHEEFNPNLPDDACYDVLFGDIENRCYIAFSSDIGGWINFHGNNASFTDIEQIDFNDGQIYENAISWGGPGGMVHKHDHYRLRTGDNQKQLAFIQMSSTDDSSYSFRPYNVISGGTEPQSGHVSLGWNNSRFKCVYAEAFELNGSKITAWPTGGGGGTTNYNNLSNRPQINGHILTGNQTSGNLGLASSSHTHSGYASSSHNHDSSYSPKGHTHYYVENRFKAVPCVKNDNVTRYVITTCKDGDGTEVDMIYTAGTTLKAKGNFNGSYVTRTVSTTSSDIRIKKNIFDTDITDALSFISKIRLKKFDWKDTNKHQKIGFIADELEQLDPLLSLGGGYDEDGNMDVKSVNSFYLQGYEVKAIQELNEIQTFLKRENQKLKNDILILQGELSILKQKMEEANNVKN